MAWDGIHRNQPQKERKMTKAEALRKMEELREFIEELDKQPEVECGQLWKNGYGDLYLVTHPKDGQAQGNSCRLVCIEGSHCGKLWNNDNGFGSSKDLFEYIGMGKDFIKCET